MGLPFFWNKAKEDTSNRCVQHYYSRATGHCSVCGSALCEVCIGNHGVPLCKRCVDYPPTEEEMALAEKTGKPVRRPRKARKPARKAKRKDLTPAPPSAARKKRRRLNWDQRRMILNAAAAVAVTICLILLLLTALGRNPFGIVRSTPPAEIVDRDLRGFSYFAVTRINAYKAKNGKLPSSLADIGFTDAKSWSYQVLNEDQYLLEVTMAGRSFSYNSNQDAQRVLQGAASRRRP